jgi:hypothetical protein
MVKDSGQLYTIEGIAAGLIMLLTAYFVLNSTTVYTPGDSHISDMQLEVLGNDALKMMNTRVDNNHMESPLQEIIEQDDGVRFKTMFMNLTNNRSGSSRDRIQFSANYSYRMENATVALTNSTRSFFLTSSRPLTGGEHAVRVTQFAMVNIGGDNAGTGGISGNFTRAVLVEVLMWRD